VPHPAARQPRKDALRNRERVLDAATELIRRDGEKVPIARIAEHAGLGVGTVYRHFATREDLLGALVYRSFGLAVDNARAAAAHPGSAVEGVRAFFLATLRDASASCCRSTAGP
jgi:AcrR family transcriptional regulator